MSESRAIGIRLEDKFLDEIDSLGKKKHMSRSSMMRVLLREGYGSYMKKRAAESYIRGEVTLSEAAERAGLTVWEMERYLIMKGFRSQYNVDELRDEAELLAKRLGVRGY